MRNLLFVLQFIVLSIHIGWAAQDDAFDFNKVAAIKILPYTPITRINDTLDTGVSGVASQDQTSSFSSSSCFGRQYKSPDGKINEFNIGKTFSYITLDDYSKINQNNEIPFYMEQLVNYHKDFNDDKDDKNVLFVRMQLTVPLDSSTETVYEYFFGIFVSGGQDYLYGEIRELTGFPRTLPVCLNNCFIPPNSPVPLKDLPIFLKVKDLPISIKNSLESKILRLLWEDDDVKKHIKEYSLINEDEYVDLTKFLSENLYKKKVFNFLPKKSAEKQEGSEKKKFAPFSNKGTHLSKTIQKRTILALEGEESQETDETLISKKKNRKLPKQLPDSELPDSEIATYKTKIFRADLTQQLYGRPCYIDTKDGKACFGSGCESYFNQSEQAFLSWLEGSTNFGPSLNDLPHCYSLQPFPKKDTYKVSKIQIDLFSFLDICRYCRGTMSYMLGTRKMQDIFVSFFNKLEIQIEPLTKDVTKIFAFSYEKTGIE